MPLLLQESKGEIMGLGSALGTMSQTWEEREAEKEKERLKELNSNQDYMDKISSTGMPGHMDRLKVNEGFRGNVYQDTMGHDTIGYGHKLTGEDKRLGKYVNGISTLDAENLLREDYESHKQSTKSVVPNIDSYPEHVQEVLYDMGYNMGAQGLSSFTNTLSAIDRADYKGAYEGIMGSRYATQVGDRARRNAEALLKGGW